MLVEQHILQNFAPSNLNRDDTGSPKDCEFGGYRRARISSQCLKRAVRNAFTDFDLLPAEQQAERTKRVAKELVTRLVGDGKSEDEAWLVARTALGSIGFVVDGAEDLTDRKTEYLLFLGRSEIERFAETCFEQWSLLSKVARSAQAEAERKAQRAKRATANPREWRDSAQEAMQKDARPVINTLRDLLDGGKSVDVALFGRMLANLPEKNIDAASQVAHALSTNQVSMEFDYYTAVDDLKPEDTAGADMIGTIEFNSACFYRYLNVDTGQLIKNLGGDSELARAALDAFLRASVHAVPTGKQNSFSAQNPPSLVFTVVRDRGAWSLANAFLRPVRPEREGRDLVQNSVCALDRYWGELTSMYGDRGIRGLWVASLDQNELSALAPSRVGGVDMLVQETVAAAFVDGQGGGGA